MGKNILVGIYKIESLIKPERIYVGSSVNIEKRWKTHRIELKQNRHHSIVLQRHYNKYGKDDLVFSILMECDHGDLIPIGGVVLLEQMFFGVYKYKNSNKPYFNISPTAGSTMGVFPTQETKNKLSNILSGRIFSEEHRRKIGEANSKRKITEETRGKMKKPKTEEHKHNMSKNHANVSGIKNPMFGRKHTQETKKKQSEIGKKRCMEEGYVNPMQGRKHTKETKEKIRIKRIGRKISKETNFKKSLSMKEYWRLNKNKRSDIENKPRDNKGRFKHK